MHTISDAVSIETPPNRCPVCGEVNELTTGVGAARPAEGDLSLCFSCGTLSIFNADLTIRPPTEAEQAELNASPQVRAAVEAFRTVHNERPKH
ncbi:hypothetical protein [Hyphomicrobium sp.]|uniref:hypothetical protein n=1 Tax=Hyphomicrobium sp. TaxID=82 RepID=UPI001DE49B53|nr:hypothetical protein [Hyphomicrobium sp.]MBY0559895.1 hypothetical protein [Hyphomicrobium sp.]